MYLSVPCVLPCPHDSYLIHMFVIAWVVLGKGYLLMVVSMLLFIVFVCQTQNSVDSIDLDISVDHELQPTTRVDPI